MSNVGPTHGAEPPAGVIYELAHARSRKAGKPARSGDATGITSAGRELASASAVVSAAQDVRPERVQALKMRIDAGEYQPDPEAIAHRLLNG